MAGGIVSCLALAGPTWEKIPLPVHKQEGALVILFDLSPSMLAEDIKPNRLTRARLKAIDLLQQYREGSVALVAYAGDAHVVTPLTDDGNTLIALLPSLHPDLMPQAGSNPEQALETGLELAMNAGHLEGDILYITDGMTQAAQENLQRILQGMGDFRLSVLGVGTADGAPIPLGSSGFARDNRGAIVVATLPAGPLQSLAKRSGGRYSTITADDSDIQYLLAPLADRKHQQTRALERTLDTWDDKGYWLTLALLPLLVLLFRRGLVALLLVAPLLYSPSSDASLWDDLWSTRDQQGIKALENEQPGKAMQLFSSEQWRGIAAYRNGDFKAAEQAFSSDNSATGHYNRGNALARQGKLAEAIEAYNKALELDPQNEDAASNKALLEALLKQQENQQQEPQNQSSQDQSQDGVDSQSQSPQQEQQQGQQESGESSPQSDQADANPDQESSQKNDSNQGESTPSESSGEQSGDDSGADQPPPAEQQNQQSSSAQQDTDDGQGLSQGPKPDAEDNESQAQGQSEKDAEGNKETAQGIAPGAEASPGDSAATDQSATAASESDEPVDESLEQWLRRVPDDPGGLLRRKFEYESRQRFRQQQQQRSLPPDQYSEERW